LYIASKILKTPKESLIFGFESNEKMEKIAIQYVGGKPLSKIFYEKHFWEYTFFTNRYTLDPRPSTERIIEEVVKRHSPYESFTFLDLGSGTGAICGTILSIFPNSSCVAIDRSVRALRITQINLERLGVSKRCRILKNNWLNGIEEKFDLLLSNPPYLSYEEYDQNKNILQYDPKIALVMRDPLLMYKRIAERKKQIMALFKSAYLCY
jgi:release factor glutamine methyltransferase